MVGKCLQIMSRRDKTITWLRTFFRFPLWQYECWGWRRRAGYSSGDSSEPLDTNNNVLFWTATRIPTSLNHTSLPIFGVEARIDINLPLYDLNPPSRSTWLAGYIYPGRRQHISACWDTKLSSGGLTVRYISPLGPLVPEVMVEMVTEEKAFVIVRREFVVILQFSSGRAS